MALVSWRDGVRVVASPVDDVFVYCLENDEGDGGINGEGMGGGRS